MVPLAKVGTAGRTGLAAAEDAAEPAKTDGAGVRAQEGDEPECDRLNERVEKRTMDETGKVKMKR